MGFLVARGAWWAGHYRPSEAPTAGACPVRLDCPFVASDLRASCVLVGSDMRASCALVGRVGNARLVCAGCLGCARLVRAGCLGFARILRASCLGCACVVLVLSLVLAHFSLHPFVNVSRNPVAVLCMRRGVMRVS